MTKILIDSTALSKRVNQLAAEIVKDHPNGPPIFVGVLNGAVEFMMRLLGEFPAEFAASIQYDFVNASSYDRNNSRREVEIGPQGSIEIKGCEVVVVDGIVDTGLTLNRLLTVLKEKEPRSLAVCALLDKESRRVHQVEMRYVGFKIADHFVVGFGMDYNQQFRCLPHVATLDPTLKGIDK